MGNKYNSILPNIWIRHFNISIFTYLFCRLRIFLCVPPVPDTIFEPMSPHSLQRRHCTVSKSYKLIVSRPKSQKLQHWTYSRIRSSGNIPVQWSVVSTRNIGWENSRKTRILRIFLCLEVGNSHTKRSWRRWRWANWRGTGRIFSILLEWR